MIRDRCCYLGSYRVPVGFPIVIGHRIEFAFEIDAGAVIEITEDGSSPFGPPGRRGAGTLSIGPITIGAA